MGAPSTVPPDAKPTTYRSSQSLTRALVDQITVCVEEGLYSQAIALLTTSLVSGNATNRPANIPSPRFIALAATLSVHPSMTTRTTSRDKHAAADAALQYITLLKKHASPQDAKLREAFRFDGVRDQRAERARFRKSVNLDEHQIESLRCTFATRESLWTQTDDFWNMVGWAFNSSVMAKHRWQRWKHLIAVLLDILEEDVHLIAAAKGSMDDTLLGQYLATTRSGRNNKRKIMRAILTDGTTKCLEEFREVWQNETALPVGELNQAIKNRTLNVEKGDYADYDNNSDEEPPTNRPTTMLRASLSKQSTDNLRQPRVDDGGSLGDHESIKLRQRFLTLLLNVSTVCPHAFVDEDELFDLYKDYLGALSSQAFEELVPGFINTLSVETHVDFDCILLQGMLEDAAPDDNSERLTQAAFESNYAQFTAKGVDPAANARVSLLVEDLLRLLWRSGKLQYSELLRQHTEQGVRTRLDKAGCNLQLTKNDITTSQECLRQSSRRIYALLNMIQQQA